MDWRGDRLTVWSVFYEWIWNLWQSGGLSFVLPISVVQGLLKLESRDIRSGQKNLHGIQQVET